ncbi:hypothetical protein LCGC14_2710200, partial [marine sediment metagenome]
HLQIAHEEYEKEKKEDEEQFEQQTQMPQTSPSMPTMENTDEPEDTWNHAKYEQKEAWAHQFLNNNPAFANELWNRNYWAQDTSRESWRNQSSYVTEQMPEIMGLTDANPKADSDTEPNAEELLAKASVEIKKNFAPESWASQAKIFDNPKKKL